MTKATMTRTRRAPATPEAAAAAIEFQPLTRAQTGPLPSLVEWEEAAGDEYPAMLVATTVLSKTKPELVQEMRQDMSAMTTMFATLSETISRYEAGLKTLQAARARLLIAASCVAVQP